MSPNTVPTPEIPAKAEPQQVMLPAQALSKPWQFALVKGAWRKRARFANTKHKGACKGAFGGSRE